MRVVVFGANGPTGRLLTQAVLDAGHQAIAVTRHPEQIDAQPGLTVQDADATDPVAVTTVITGADAVVSVLGTAFSRDPITLYSTSARAITQAMAQAAQGGAGPRRLVVTSSGAARGWLDPNWSWLERHLITRVLDLLGRTLYEDMRRMKAVVQATDLDWTIMRPLGLADFEPPTEYDLAEDHIAGRQTARRDLAAAIADQLIRHDYIHKTVAVATTNKSQNTMQTIWREGIQPKLKRS